jgi:hypothetical protein
MHLRILPDHQKLFVKKDIFYHLELLKACFDAFAHTSRRPETFFKTDIFYCLEWLQACFYAFVHNSRTTRNFFSKEIFFTI